MLKSNIISKTKAEKVFQQFTLDGKPFIPNEILPYRYITLKEQKEFVEFLVNMKVITSNQEKKLLECATRYEKYRCASNHDHSRVTRYMGCGLRGICPRCSMGYAHKRAGIMFAWLQRNVVNYLSFDLKMNQITLTLPKELHDVDQKIFKKMIKYFMNTLGVESFGYSIQTDHSTDPLGEIYNHAHILTLNMKEKGGIIVQSDHFFDLAKLRLIWKSSIEKFTGVKVQGNVNLHNEYASLRVKPTQVKHMLAYLYRYPIQDVFYVQVRKSSINYVQKEQIKHVKRLRQLLEKKPRLVWCGWLSSAKRKQFIELLGISESMWANLRDVEKILDERAKLCRDCGLPLEERPYDVGIYDGKNEPCFAQ